MYPEGVIPGGGHVPRGQFRMPSSGVKSPAVSSPAKERPRRANYRERTLWAKPKAWVREKRPAGADPWLECPVGEGTSGYHPLSPLRDMGSLGSCLLTISSDLFTYLSPN